MAVARLQPQTGADKMKIDESSLWNWLSTRANNELGARLHMRRVENNVSIGDPDVEGCLDGKGFDIELKAVARTEDGWVEPGLKNHQAMWLIRRSKAGGLAYALVQVGAARDAKRYLIPAAVCTPLCTRVHETELELLSICLPTDEAHIILLQAIKPES